MAYWEFLAWNFDSLDYLDSYRKTMKKMQKKMKKEWNWLIREPQKVLLQPSS
jgi:hypothetical protein